MAVNPVVLQVTGLRTEIATQTGPLKAVDGIDLSIRRGETLVLLGESGSGKSMTALSLMRLLPPPATITLGRVELDGTDLTLLPEFAMRQVRGNRMAMIFQEPMTSLNPVMTIGSQIVEAIRQHRRLTRAQAR
jgi:ABC-type dipeptide/oligopeptide/nickel transport system ATPase component